jgi:hypothetical protein
LLIGRKKKIILDMKKSRFSRMKLAVCRLETANRWKSLKVGVDSRVNDALKNFGNEVKIRDGTIAGKIIRR